MGITLYFSPFSWNSWAELLVPSLIWGFPFPFSPNASVALQEKCRTKKKALCHHIPEDCPLKKKVLSPFPDGFLPGCTKITEKGPLQVKVFQVTAKCSTFLLIFLWCKCSAPICFFLPASGQFYFLRTPLLLNNFTSLYCWIPFLSTTLFHFFLPLFPLGDLSWVAGSHRRPAPGVSGEQPFRVIQQLCGFPWQCNTLTSPTCLFPPLKRLCITFSEERSGHDLETTEGYSGQPL